MKVLLINGSPHEKGCTYTALSLVAEELNTAGIDTEILHVGGQPVGGCIGCGGCAAGNGCAFGGVVNEAIEKAKTARRLCFWQPGPLRLCCRQHGQLYGPPGLRWRQAPGLQACRYLRFGTAAGTTATLDQLAKYPEFFHMPLVSGSYWPMVHGSNPEQVLQDEEGCAVMRELGRNMAWLLYCIRAGRDAGFEHPQNPPRPRTGFIR